MFKRLSILIFVSFLFSSCTVLQQIAQSQQANQQKQGGGAKTNQGQAGAKRDIFKPTGTRYVDKVFNDYNVVQETFLTGVTTWNGGKTNLTIDIYTPKGDKEVKGRACIIFFYGGAWASKVKRDFDTFNSELAMRGYVAITGDYRIGFPQDKSALLCIGNVKKNMPEAAFRAFQDTKALIRHVRANADKYGIDPNKIYVAGESAGGANALGATYFDDSEVPKEISSVIGGLESIGNYKQISSKPNGLITLAGPLMGPASAIEKQNVPVYILQGQCDELIPWDYDAAFPHCDKNKMPVVLGGHGLFERLKAVGETVWFDMVCGGGHSSFDWGIVELNRRMANFCFLVMNGQMRTGDYYLTPEKSKCPGKTFPECEQYKQQKK